jgi:hypothetical protein
MPSASAPKVRARYILNKYPAATVNSVPIRKTEDWREMLWTCSRKSAGVVDAGELEGGEPRSEEGIRERGHQEQERLRACLLYPGPNAGANRRSESRRRHSPRDIPAADMRYRLFVEQQLRCLHTALGVKPLLHNVVIQKVG